MNLTKFFSTRSGIQVLVAVGLCVLVGFFIFLGEHRSASSGPSFGVCRGCNVLIIGVDTLRADRLHVFGYSRNTTPTIDALAAKGYAFSNAIAPASWTVPSFMSIFTGTYPSVHGVTNKFISFSQDQKQLSNLKITAPQIQTLAEVLKAEGYATGGFTGDAGVSGKFGYNLGFDAYTDEKAFGGLENSKSHALAWADQLGDKHFFMFFHGYDLHGQSAPSATNPFLDSTYHGPYTGSPQEESVLREGVLTPKGITLTPQDAKFWSDTYDGKVVQADKELQTFLTDMSVRGLLKNTLIVLVSDHGEEFYEHKGFDHGHTLYDELVHVPLIFVVPGMQGGQIIKSQVSTMDVMPTILYLLGITPRGELSNQLSGRANLASYFTATSTKGYDVFSETNYRGYTYKRSVRTADGWKYILTLETGKEELYNLTVDKGEHTNLVLTDADKAEQLRVELRNHLEQDLHYDMSKTPAVTCLPVYDGECK